MISIHAKIHNIFNLCSVKLFPTKFLYIHSSQQNDNFYFTALLLPQPDGHFYRLLNCFQLRFDLKLNFLLCYSLFAVIDSQSEKGKKLIKFCRGELHRKKIW